MSKSACSSHYIEVAPHIKLYVRDWGSGKPILFIHGWPLNHAMFEYQFVKFPALGYRCIGIDMRGTGKSDAPWGPYTYDMFADDIKAVIDALALKDIILAGFSMGGAMTLHYLARYNNYKVSKVLFLAAAAPLFTQRSDFPYGFTQVEVTQLINSSYQDRPSMIAGCGEIFFNKKKSPSFMNWIQDMCMSSTPNATAEWLITLRDADLRADMAKVTVPTAIFHGKKDKICPFEFGETMHKNIKGSKLVVFEESGHGLWHDELEKFNKEFLQFASE